jgi:hypothetical protein
MIRKLEYVLLAWGVLSLVASCRSDSPRALGAQMPYTGEGFRVMIPLDMRVQKAEPMDFIRYSFVLEGKSILDAYVGNQPNILFGDPAVGAESIARVNGLPCKRLQSKKADGSIRTEVLICFPRSYGWPAYIHFWHGPLEPESSRLAEAIIASLQPQQTQGVSLSRSPNAEGPDFPPTPVNSEKISPETEEPPISAEEKAKREQEIDQRNEEIQASIITLMEQDLEKERPGLTAKEIKEWEACITQEKERLRLLKEEHRRNREHAMQERH